MGEVLIQCHHLDVEECVHTSCHTLLRVRTAGIQGCSLTVLSMRADVVLNKGCNSWKLQPLPSILPGLNETLNILFCFLLTIHPALD
jgi:hypothetical protein